jgi:hypothetical protein
LHRCTVSRHRSRCAEGSLLRCLLRIPLWRRPPSTRQRCCGRFLPPPVGGECLVACLSRRVGQPESNERDEHVASVSGGGCAYLGSVRAMGGFEEHVLVRCGDPWLIRDLRNRLEYDEGAGLLRGRMCRSRAACCCRPGLGQLSASVECSVSSSDWLLASPVRPMRPPLEMFQDSDLAFSPKRAARLATCPSWMCWTTQRQRWGAGARMSSMPGWERTVCV